MYQLSGTDNVRAWLAGQPDPERRLAFLDWLPLLAADPEGVATARKQRPGIPVFTAEVRECDAWVTYSVIEQYRTVHILRVDPSTPLPG